MDIICALFVSHALHTSWKINASSTALATAPLSKSLMAASAHALPLSCRRAAGEWSKTCSRELFVHAEYCGVNSQTRSGQRRHKINRVKSIDEHPLLESSNPALDAVVDSLCLACDWVEILLREHSIPLNVERDHQNWWEGVGEVQDKGSTNEANQVRDLGNCSSDDECQRPIYGDCALD